MRIQHNSKVKAFPVFHITFCLLFPKTTIFFSDEHLTRIKIKINKVSWAQQKGKMYPPLIPAPLEAEDCQQSTSKREGKEIKNERDWDRDRGGGRKQAGWGKKE